MTDRDMPQNNIQVFSVNPLRTTEFPGRWSVLRVIGPRFPKLICQFSVSLVSRDPTKHEWYLDVALIEDEFRVFRLRRGTHEPSSTQLAGLSTKHTF